MEKMLAGEKWPSVWQNATQKGQLELLAGDVGRAMYRADYPTEENAAVDKTAQIEILDVASTSGKQSRSSQSHASVNCLDEKCKPIAREREDATRTAAFGRLLDPVGMQERTKCAAGIRLPCRRTTESNVLTGLYENAFSFQLVREEAKR